MDTYYGHDHKGPQPRKCSAMSIRTAISMLRAKVGNLVLRKIRIFNSHPNDGDVSLKFGVLCRPIIMSPLDVKLSFYKRERSEPY